MNFIEDDHRRTIIHIDLDCFYAQVEMLKNPALKDVPLGIQQKNIVVTSNYIARKSGIKKCMLVTEAYKLCPSLVLVKGEDLHDYRQTSYKVTSLLQKYSPVVERLGLDENFVDISKIIDDRLRCSDEVVGYIFGDLSDTCDCGCFRRLQIGTIVAQEIRDQIKKELGLTSCAGIAHNKLLAKIVGAVHKPNAQTVVFPNSASQLLSSLSNVESIPGIGKVAYDSLKQLNIHTVRDLQECENEVLCRVFSVDKVRLFKSLSLGRDNSTVKTTGKPLSIGLEDSCRPITLETEIREKLEQLLLRLMILVNEDGRLPRTLKLVIRKFDSNNKISHRETKQCNISQTMFKQINGGVELNVGAKEKILNTLMALFIRLVNPKKAFHITLLGLSFTKFQERLAGKNSILSFMKKNMEVQAVTNIENRNDDSLNMDYDSPHSDFCTDGSESELEPSPKKQKLTKLIAKRRYFDDNYPSPSKLHMAELTITKSSNTGDETADDNQNLRCPPNIDNQVFDELPKEVQEELWNDYLQRKSHGQSFSCQVTKRPKINSILNYLVKK